MRYGRSCAVALALWSGCGMAAAPSARSPNRAPPVPPAPVATIPPAAAADMQAVLDQLPLLGARAIETLTPVEARLQPTAADAARAAMRRAGLSIAPDPAVATRDLPYGDDARQFARLYTPVGAAGGALPVVVYFHGGGWVIADVNAYDATPRLLSRQLNAVVVSVEYRRAPEHPFPAQHDDAAAAYRWVVQNAAAWGADPARIVLAGESAGGNLAVATALFARDHRLTMPRHILSIYPIANAAADLPSRRDSFNAVPLGTPMLDWFASYHTQGSADRRDPRLDLVRADLRGLPPTTIVTAQIDPLRSDGETLAQALRGAGVRVEQRSYAGMTHEFFGMGPIVRGAYDANQYAVARLKSAFAK